MVKHYEENFKKQIVEIYNQGNYTYNKLGEEYQIAPSTIRGWEKGTTTHNHLT